MDRRRRRAYSPSSQGRASRADSRASSVDDRADSRADSRSGDYGRGDSTRNGRGHGDAAGSGRGHGRESGRGGRAPRSDTPMSTDDLGTDILADSMEGMTEQERIKASKMLLQGPLLSHVRGAACAAGRLAAPRVVVEDEAMATV